MSRAGSGSGSGEVGSNGQTPVSQGPRGRRAQAMTQIDPWETHSEQQRQKNWLPIRTRRNCSGNRLACPHSTTPRTTQPCALGQSDLVCGTAVSAFWPV